jgi:hypothetical protein
MVLLNNAEAYRRSLYNQLLEHADTNLAAEVTGPAPLAAAQSRLNYALRGRMNCNDGLCSFAEHRTEREGVYRPAGRPVGRWVGPTMSS